MCAEHYGSALRPQEGGPSGYASRSGLPLPANGTPPINYGQRAELYFFLIVGFYLAGLLGRLLLRRWIIRKQKEFEQGGNPFFRTYTWGGGGHSRNAKPKPEGKVTVEQTRMTQKRVSGDVGDYVEYEEIKVSRETESGTDADASGREPQQK